VKKPQKIVEEMSEEGYEIVIFGDSEHPEVKSVKSYSKNEPTVVLSVDELEDKALSQHIAIVSQTTKKPEDFLKVVNHLITRHKEVRVFNTICNATFENQDATMEISKQADVMVVIGGKNSSNTKQLFNISKQNCNDSYLIESQEELEENWFKNKQLCGIAAGASTPNWIVENIIKKIKNLKKDGA
jgi:4-hydroxy-3-methylbut-2-enyl diphosphate reductase